MKVYIEHPMLRAVSSKDLYLLRLETTKEDGSPSDLLYFYGLEQDKETGMWRLFRTSYDTLDDLIELTDNERSELKHALKNTPYPIKMDMHVFLEQSKLIVESINNI